MLNLTSIDILREFARRAGAELVIPGDSKLIAPKSDDD
jgi:hypothetical protein